MHTITELPLEAVSVEEGHNVAAPAGRFTEISISEGLGCGLKVGGSIVCWGDDNAGQARAPGPAFTQVAVGTGNLGSGQFACGLRTDHSLVCWGNPYDGETRSWGGSYAQVAAGVTTSCGLRINAAVVCWGRSKLPTSAQRFVQFSAGDEFICGITPSGTIR